METHHYEGIGTISGGSYGELKIEGVYSLQHEITTETLDIEGVFHANAAVNAGSFFCEGVANFHAPLTAKTAKIEGVIHIKQDFHADNVRLDGVLNAENIFVTEEIIATGVIHAKKLTTDKASLIHDRKKYHGGIKNSIKSFFSIKNDDGEHSKIDILSAREAVLSGYCIRNLIGDNITIEKDCHIENVQAGSRLRIHKSSVVDHIEGGIVPEYFD